MNTHSLDRRSFLKASVGGALTATVAGVRGWAQSGTPAHGGLPAPSPAPVSPVEGTLHRSDLSQCQPAASLTRQFKDGCWQLTDYETEEGVKGIMVSAYPERNCGELTLPLEARGWFKIYLGINYTKSKYDLSANYGPLEVKLSGDPAFRRVAAETDTLTEDGQLKIGNSNDCYKSVQEAYWKTAEITDQSLVFRQPAAPYNFPEHFCIANLCYVKLVPLGAGERRAWEASRPRAETQRVGMIFCTGQFTGHTTGTYTFHPSQESWFENEFTPYANSDIGLLVFEAMRGNFCLFKTKLGDVGPEDNRWGDDWVDPLAAFTRLAHRHGTKIFASLRMIGPQFPMNRAPIARARHYRQHPEWAKRDRNGGRLTNWSLAFPGVRQHWLGLLREALAYGIDGIQLHLNRSAPFVMFEEPTVAGFIQKHNLDPRRLPEDDPRWPAHCAGIVTEYLREVRALVNEKPGRSLAVTIFGEPSEYDPVKADFHPFRYQCDVETWIREGLVDYVMPSPYIRPELVQKWRALGGDRLHIWPDLMPRRQLPSSYARLAKKYYAMGADGVCVWDGERRAALLSEWAAVQRLGHRDQLDQLAAEAPSFYRRVPFKYLDGYSVKDSFRDG